MKSDYKTEIFCISIFNSERYLKFIEYIRQFKINFKLIEATTPKSENFLKISNLFNYEKHKIYHMDKLPSELEIACTISHLNAINISNINKNLVIFEDDSRFKINIELFKDILSEIEDHNFYDVIIFGFSKSDRKSEEYINVINPFISRYKLKIENYKYFIGDRYFHTTSGALGYFIRPSGKRKLIILNKIYHLADDWKLLEELGLKIGYLNSTIIWEDINLDSSLKHSQVFIRPKSTRFPFINFLLFVRRRLLFLYRKIILIVKSSYKKNKIIVSS